MKTPRLPAAAVWLLEAFNVADNNPALIGDLTEECSGGRSGVWLWRQVVPAIGFAIAKEIYSHKILTIRAVIAGEVAVWFSSFALSKALYSHLFTMFLFTVFAHWQPLLVFLFVPEWMIVFLFGGWIVARFQRGHRAALVFLFAALQFTLTAVGVVPTLHRHLVESIDQPRFRPYLAADMAYLFLCPIAVLVGGYLARSRKEVIPELSEHR
jgi:hypothetical protein